MCEINIYRLICIVNSPFASSMSTTPRCPSAAATMTAVRPCLSFCSRGAPCWSNKSTSCQWPALAAHSRAGIPRLLVPSSEAPRCRSMAVESSWPARQAAVRVVSPHSVSVMSMPKPDPATWCRSSKKSQICRKRKTGVVTIDKIPDHAT